MNHQQPSGHLSTFYDATCFWVQHLSLQQTQVVWFGTWNLFKSLLCQRTWWSLNFYCLSCFNTHHLPWFHRIRMTTVIMSWAHIPTITWWLLNVFLNSHFLKMRSRACIDDYTYASFPFTITLACGLLSSPCAATIS